MHVFGKAEEKWWQKPLVLMNDAVLPAELAVLQLEKGDGEDGVWINSRGTTSGVTGLERVSGKLRTVRKDLPDAVSTFLIEAYRSTSLAKGCPDLVIWNTSSMDFRFVEVKCPVWDRPTKEQNEFMAYARSLGVGAEIVEWVFEKDELGARRQRTAN